MFDRATELRVDERVISPAFVQFARDVTDLSLRYFDGLLELGRRYQDEMLRSATRRSARSAGTRDGSAADFASIREVVEIDLHAPAGAVAHGPPR